MVDSKTVWTSKTFWINIIAMVFLIIQYTITDFVAPPQAQASVLAVVNIILRLITKTEIVWDKK